MACALDPVQASRSVARVRIGGKPHVVKSFNHGKYTLEGHESTLTQWELLRDRCDGGVTLDADLRRFIIHLVQK
ncbi:unnamed protein product [Pylaiella littoralis]